MKDESIAKLLTVFRNVQGALVRRYMPHDTTVDLLEAEKLMVEVFTAEDCGGIVYVGQLRGWTGKKVNE